MSQARQQTRNWVLGWFGYGLAYSEDDDTWHPPDPTSQSAPPVATEPDRVGTEALATDAESLRDYPPRKLLDGLRTRLDELRSTRRVLDAVIDRLPRGVDAIEARTASVGRRVTAWGAAVAGGFRQVAEAGRQTWNAEGPIGVLARFDLLRAAPRRAFYAAINRIRRGVDATCTRAAGLQRRTASSLASASGWLRQLVEARRRLRQPDGPPQPLAPVPDPPSHPIDAERAADPKPTLQPVDVEPEASPKPSSPPVDVSGVAGAAPVVAATTPVVDEEPMAERIPTDEEEPTGMHDVLPPAAVAPSWKDRLSDLPGLGRVSSLSIFFESKTPPSILTHEPDLSEEDPFEEPERPDVVDRLERMLEQEAQEDEW